MSEQEDGDFIRKIKNYAKKFIADIDVKEVAILFVFGIIIFFVFKMMFGGIFGLSLVVIENGPCPNSSMCPTYDKGDMFLINKVAPEKIELGDVIVYESSFDGKLIIHRVINITIDGSDYTYRVSGDNYETNDRIDSYGSFNTRIPYEAVKGKTVMIIRKVGYLRLWFSDNPVIRNILLVIVVGIGAYLILAPDKKSEEEKAKEEQEKTAKVEQEKKEFKLRVKEFFVNSWNNTKKWFIELFTVKRKRIKLIIFCSVILLLVILIPVIDQGIKVQGATTGIDDISGLNLDDFTYSTENIVFLSFNIHYSHDGSWNDVLRDFYVEGLQNGTVIGTFRWKAHYQPEVDGFIGGSLIFDINEFDDGQSLTIKITYDIQHKFGADDVGLVYQETFTALDW